MKTDKTQIGQTQRILDALIASPGKEFSMPELVNIAAKPDGIFISSFTRRISDCRARLVAMGQCIPKPRIVRDKDTGQIHTFYKVVPQDSTQPLATA